MKKFSLLIGLCAFLALPSWSCQAAEDGEAQSTSGEAGAQSEQLQLFSGVTSEVSVAIAASDVGERPPGPPARRRPLQSLIRVVAERFSIDPRLLSAVVQAESGGDSSAVSPAGARGVCQIMPATAARFGVPAEWLSNPAINLSIAAAELRRLQIKYHQDLSLVLSAYNAGEGAVARSGGQIPPYAETRRYVRRVADQLGLLFSSAFNRSYISQ